MATRVLIAMQTDFGFKAIYCHNNGLGNLPILRTYYNDVSKINELLELGSISVLGAQVAPKPGEQHSFDDPARNVVIAYHRDRGEPKHDAMFAPDWDNLLDRAKALGADYVLMYQNKEWRQFKTY